MISLLILLEYLLINVIIAYKRPDLYYETTSSKYYLVYEDKSYCLIKDKYTIWALDYNVNRYVSIDNITKSDHYQNTNLPCPITLSSYENTDSCNTYHDFVLDKVTILTNNINEQIIDSVELIGEYFNPSVVPLDNKLLMIRRQINDNTLETIDYDFKHVNLFDYQVDHPLTKYETDIRFLKKSNGDFILVASNYYEHYYNVYTGVRTLVYNPSLKKYSLTDSLMLDFNSSTNLIKTKNWTPFNYDNEVYFIERIIPLNIYRLPNSKEQHEAVFMNGVKDSQYVHPVESIQCGLRKFNKKYYWVYGDFRGGTSAILIPNLGYLSFFHSIYMYCNRGRVVYFIGAYVISTTTPFKLLRISTNPIITSDLIYDPIQDPRPRKESIVFPMSYYPVDVNGKPIDTTNSNVKPKKLVLTIGYKDQYGKVLRIDYDKLIDSLTEVHC